jgi:hypothetical protein
MHITCFTPPLAAKTFVVICSVPSCCTLRAAVDPESASSLPTWAQRLNKREHRMTLLLASRAFAKAVRRLKIRQYNNADMTSNFRAWFTVYK